MLEVNCKVGKLFFSVTRSEIYVEGTIIYKPLMTGKGIMLEL